MTGNLDVGEAQGVHSLVGLSTVSTVPADHDHLGRRPGLRMGRFFFQTSTIN
jgi:hypothetical protein